MSEEKGSRANRAKEKPFPDTYQKTGKYQYQSQKPRKMSQQSDNTKLTTIVLSGNKNYIPWSRSAMLALSGRGKLNFVTGTKKKLEPEKITAPTEAETAKIEK